VQPRERTLAIVVVCLASIFVARWAWNLATRPLTNRAAALAQLDKDVEKQNQIALSGKVAQRKLQKLAPQSLPTGLASSAGNRFSTEMANARYSQWLAKLAADAGFASPVVTPIPAVPVQIADANRRNYPVFHRLQYSLGTSGTLEQLAKFLHGFYQPAYLHKITKLTFTPQEGGRFNFTIACEAVVIPNANKTADLPTGQAERLALAGYDDYRREIVERNLFAPANNPPTLAAVSPQTANPGATLEVQLSGSDSDKGDTLRYELVKGPDGAKVDAGTGKFTWQPKAELVGSSVECEVKVSDSRPKPESATRQFTINVAPGAPSFEVAKQAFVTAIVQVNERPQAWLLEKTSGKRQAVFEGDDFQLGELRGKVTRIGSREIEIELGGQKVVWPWSKSLFEAQEAAKGSAAAEAAKVSRAPS
jgi:hypothetical protein